jgi:lysophospholipase L1-like esterase
MYSGLVLGGGMSQRWTIGLVLAVLLLFACKDPGAPGQPGLSGGPPPPPVDGFPSSMVALGDSITAGFGSCLAPTACHRNSWATGEGTQVDSHYRRIIAHNPALRGHATNLAKPSATVSALPAQAAAAVAVPVDYVTILGGANDACHGSMTAPETFRGHVNEALSTIRHGMPNASILLVSIPNVYRVWEVGHDNRFAVAAWRSGACPNLLDNPTSTAPADAARRQAFADRIAAYNSQLAAACGAAGRCRFVDVSGYAFEFTMLSAIDFFHPNASGQEALADLTYPAAFGW